MNEQQETTSLPQLHNHLNTSSGKYATSYVRGHAQKALETHYATQHI